MTLKMCLNSGLALMMVLSLAAANLKADDPAKDVSYNEQTAQELIFVTALNEYRVSRGLHPVEVSSELSRACRQWSTHMRQRGQLSHDPMGAPEICAQITREDGMNALQVWQRSPAHNAILLSSRIDTIGIGSDDIWWTMRGSQSNAERTVFRTTYAQAEVVDDDTIGRVPMSASKYSVQKVVSGESPKTVERTVSAITDARAEVVENDDTIGRVPMSVSKYSVQRAVSGGSPKTVERTASAATDARAEVVEDDTIGRVPMSVSEGSVQRRVSTVTPFGFRFR